MSGHHHDDHHSTEQKPVSFTVPFYMAIALLIILLSFLSLCDPKKGHHGECSHEGKCTEECAKGHEHGMKEGESHHEAAAAAPAETAVADPAATAAEPAAEAKAEEAHH